MKLAKPLLAVAAFAALATASTAHARTDVVFSIGFPAPAYVQPRPVYVAPPVVYHEPVRVHSRGRGGAWGDWDRDGVPNLHDRDSRFYDWRAARAARRDRDGDGVPNRFDRAPYNPYYH